ncbi:SGNH/GDSL hydrolase family protein [Solibacillus sp. CAU 1738]|uniref:SGNH/GDSL hydrolase family protein n=1 Tax=Solibacillus sp. CAU 1738 TaxID=3140363 RepID=UPI003260A041
MKKWILLVLFLVCATEASAKEIYIPIGDSIAAGQTPYRQIDVGYTDLIARQLALSGQLLDYTKELTFPGYTVADVVNRIEQEDARALLADATLITISAGANDLLPLVQANPSAGTLTFSQLSADFALNRARKNFITLLDKVEQYAPNAEIYVIGYYFPYPNVHESQKIGTEKQLTLLNEILKKQAELQGAHFINVAEPFAANATSYLPNIADVHPTIEGYLVMANAFLREFNGSELAKEQLPAPNPLTFEQLLKLRENNSREERSDVAKKEQMNDIEKYIIRFGYYRNLV